MNTYPGFYRAACGREYLYLDKSNYFSFERGIWDKSDSADNHEDDTNITREYLANTKVKIESEGHEILVRGVASNADLLCALINGTAFIFDRDIEDANKEIIIPLPPTQLPEVNPGTPMPEVKEPKKVSMNDIQVNVKNNTDSVVQVTKSDDESSIFICVSDLPKELESEGISQLERKPYQGGGLWKPFIAKAIKEPEPKEWPQVGDEVAWSPKLSRKGTLLNVYEGMAWVKDSYGEFVSIEVNKLKKPLTPEEELESRIRGMIEFFDYNSKAIAEYIISCELKV